MVSRRGFILTAGALCAAATAARAGDEADSCVVFTRDMQAAITPEQALQLLREGNARFVAGKTIHCDPVEQVRAGTAGQAPFAAVVGCIDSRVPPELVFDQHLGSILSARIAGNFVNTDIIGSLEFSCKVLGAKAIVVLGHSDCGAIKGAIDHVEFGNVTALLENIALAVAATASDGARTSKDKPFVQAVADTNAKLAAAAILDRSPLLKEMADNKQIAVVSAMQDLATGKVTFFT
ncbi:MAG: carbonic anhydrase family protein [Rhodospirillales bacterium]